MSARWTCQPSIGLVILELDLHVGIVDLSPQDWTCHSEAVLNIKLGMCLDLHVGTLDFSVRHWTCHFEAGPSAQLHSQYQIIVVCRLDCWDIELVTLALDLLF